MLPPPKLLELLLQIELAVGELVGEIVQTGRQALPGIDVLNTIVIAMIVITTVYSGVEYFIQNWKCLWD